MRRGQSVLHWLSIEWSRNRNLSTFLGRSGGDQGYCDGIVQFAWWWNDAGLYRGRGGDEPQWLGSQPGGSSTRRCARHRRVFGRTLIAEERSPPAMLALTFDDGPNDAATPQLLEVLARHNVRATFFAMGSFARQRPEIVRASWLAAGTFAGQSHDEPSEVVNGICGTCAAGVGRLQRRA